MTILSLQGDVLYCGRRPVENATYAKRVLAAQSVYSPAVAAAVAGGDLTHDAARSLGLQVGLLKEAR